MRAESCDQSARGVPQFRASGLRRQRKGQLQGKHTHDSRKRNSVSEPTLSADHKRRRRNESSKTILLTLI